MRPEIAGELRYACRFLRRTPAFTLPVIASLALGIAVNTTLFSVVSATLLRPLAAADGRDLVRVLRSERGERSFKSVDYEDFLYLREHASSFADLAGHQIESVVMRAGDDVHAVSAEIVAGSYFAVLGMQPVLGRDFTTQEDGGSADAVVIISDAFWRRTFAAERNAVGRTLHLNGYAYTIIGVAPPGFHGTFPGVAVDLWLPATLVDAAQPGTQERSLMLLGRLNPGISAAAAEADLDLLAERLTAENPGRDPGRTFVVASARGVHPAFAGVLRVFLSLLMGVCAVVLLIACANVSSLLLARANARRAELAIRLALGASRGQLMKQLLIESCVLAVLGGVTGLLLAIWPVRLLNSVSLASGPTGAGIFFDLQLDARVLLFTAMTTVLTALVFGVGPAVHATRVGVLSTLQDARTAIGARRSRLRSTLVVVQVGLSFVLLVAAGLLFRSVHNSSSMDVGFDPDNVLVASFDFESLGHDRPRVESFYVELLSRARTLPFVEHAALADFVPMGDRRGHPQALSVPGRDTITVAVGRISDQYFATVRQPLVRGREFTTADRRVAIVNEALVRRYWPDEDALGRRIGMGEGLAEHTIIGVVKDAKYASYGAVVEPLVFLPAFGELQLQLHVRSAALRSAVPAAINRLAQSIDADVPIRTRTMREAMAFSLIPARIGQSVLGIAGAIALLLATGGLYGLMCYTLEQRLPEMGIRIALGATRTGIFMIIVGDAVRLASIGIVGGIFIAAAVTRLIRASLYGLSPTDPLTFSGIAALLIAVTLAAGYAATRKGTGVDPVAVLRHDYQ
ncbi:MAG TPA: ABC transporter permease [Longimicrobiales bacterium]|nr:ABC transporter permease [Longimicrobiales bacterium]